MRRPSLLLAAALGLSAVLATPAVAGGPWISIETPVNPFNNATQHAFCLVRVYHHSNPAYYPVTGTAEGIVNGQRRSIPLTLTDAGSPGLYAVKYTPEKEGTWMLVFSVGEKQEGHNVTVLLSVSPEGHATYARVPMTKADGGYPLLVGPADIDRLLRDELAANSSTGHHPMSLALAGLILIPLGLRSRRALRGGDPE